MTSKKKEKVREEITEIKDTGTKTENKRDIAFIALVAIVAVLGILVVFNGFQINSLTQQLITGKGSNIGTGNVVSNLPDVIPKGVPAVYGNELGISYNDVSPVSPSKANEAIDKLARLDNSITLTGEKLQRYIAIASSISCEYCCGAESIIFPNGQAACGCAHSYAMRGLGKYLLQKHADMSDLQILEELGKWKVLFFPDIHKQKAAILQQNGIELNYINLASNKYRGIEQGATGGMVGGC